MNTQSRILTFIALLAMYTLPAQADWQTISPGVAYQDLSPFYIKDWSHIHVFKIDLNKQKFQLVLQQQVELTFPSIAQYAQYQKAPLLFNGGFFDKKQHPLGLRISNYKKLNPYKHISWWSVFYIKNNQAHITHSNQFHLVDRTEFAVQAGPRLIDHGKIPSLKPGYAERTALCILPNQEVAVIITQYFPMTLHQLARMLSDKPLQCQQAMNLDGGSSTQFFAKFSNFYLHMPGLSSVSDVIAVSPRS